MGFGIIALGWLFFADIPWNIDLLVDFLGCFLVIMGCRRLKPYSVHFGNAAKWFGVLVVPSVAITALEIASMVWDRAWIEELLFHVDILHTLIFAVALFYLLMALIRISTDVGRTKIARKCRRNLAIGGVTVLYYTVIRLLYNAQIGGELVIKAWFFGHVLWYLMLVLQFIQIFSCYMWICYEGDEDMPMKEVSYKTNPYARFGKKKADREQAQAEQQAAERKKKKRK